MADDGYNRNSIIGGYKGAPIKSSMLGRNLKTRGALSNNLPFRLANGLAPSSPYQFLFPTGTEKGAVWRFSQSGEEYQDAVTPVTAVGQAIGMILDSRLNKILGPSLVTDPDFNGTGFWSTDANVSINNGQVNWSSASVALSSVFKTLLLTTGKAYQVTYVITSVTSGGIALYAGGNTGPTRIIPGVYTDTILCGTANTSLALISTVNGTQATATYCDASEVLGNHLVQATSTARPLSAIETIGGWNQSVYSGRFDGIDDGAATPVFAAGTLTNNMDVFFAVKASNLAGINVTFGGPTVVSGATPGYFGYFRSTDVGSSFSGCGAPTLYVNGVQIVSATAQNLAAAIGNNTWVVVEYRNLDLSLWVQAPVSSYPAQLFTGNLGDAIICPAQSTTNRNLARTLVGASVGLLL